ncbi:hypothetical protein GN244_ATG02966 [Phytophthora infestans]|uniref:Uncharacterized protein n=1 Tax=Phytophthora infestans TaxID=4787 RepID=A0A833TAL0_PHYIN|nr:hypothetical protein GN244_ATG02966 [Phytophthora infestans]KAF4140106.1 hypothetical protein GN958_ATG10715 [Phytophthora infestans]
MSKLDSNVRSLRLRDRFGLVPQHDVEDTPLPLTRLIYSVHPRDIRPCGFLRACSAHPLSWGSSLPRMLPSSKCEQAETAHGPSSPASRYSVADHHSSKN